jgi:antitoxin (DNA-binding transcriptional repressor) of toxin-antitoxin stability system
MSTVSLDDVRHDPAPILTRAQAGETIIVVDANRPVLEIHPVGAVTAEPRPFGLCAGAFTVPDNFDEPLPEDIISSFEPR